MKQKSSSPSKPTDASLIATRHLRLGWLMLAGFMTLGFALEMLHGFKLQWYLSLANETRRLLWTLAHAHGALLGVLNIALGLTASAGYLRPSQLRRTSPWIAISSLLLPFGFLLGGIVIFEGDPGPAIVLAPLGGGILLVAIIATAFGIDQPPHSQDAS